MVWIYFISHKTCLDLCSLTGFVYYLISRELIYQLHCPPCAAFSIFYESCEFLLDVFIFFRFVLVNFIVFICTISSDMRNFPTNITFYISFKFPILNIYHKKFTIVNMPKFYDLFHDNFRNNRMILNLLFLLTNYLARIY